jgi:biopolymer transport protein ExbD
MKKIIITGRRPAATELNMAPLIDMIFILLIFFLVTTSFVNEAGLERKKPQPAPPTTTENPKKTNVTLGIMADNSIVDQEDGKSIDIKSVRAYIENFLIEAPKGTVVVAADKDSYIGTVIRVMDSCRLAGVKNLSVAPMTSGERR